MSGYPTSHSVKLMRPFLCAWLALLLPIAASAANPADERVKDIFGWLERVEVGDNGLLLKAKLDTGATTSSLSATDISYFERDGRRWLRFKVYSKLQDREEVFEAPLVRHVKIRRHSGKTQRRPVASLPMCVGDVLRERQFTLIDRTGFLYPVLVGRNYMKNYILVDSESTYTREPSCSSKAAPGNGETEPVADDLEEE
jgi:hypothetical protein